MDVNTEEFTTAKKGIKALKNRIELINKHLEPLLTRDLTEIYGSLPLNEKCQLDALLSFAIGSLYYMYIRTQGEDPKKHELMKELRRVQGYVNKIKAAEGKGPKRTMVVNKQAAGRMIKAGLRSDEPLAKKRTIADLASDTDSSSSQDSEEEEEIGKKGKENESAEKEKYKEEEKGTSKSKKKTRYDPFS